MGYIVKKDPYEGEIYVYDDFTHQRVAGQFDTLAEAVDKKVELTLKALERITRSQLDLISKLPSYLVALHKPHGKKLAYLTREEANQLIVECQRDSKNPLPR